MIHVFVLGYNSADYFSEWHSKNHFGDDIKFYYIDNGNQNLDEYLQSMLVYQSSKNIFCSGGWNLLCDIGFDDYQLDKIIIGQEDAVFTDDIIRNVDYHTQPMQICGTYDGSFEFSLFGIHKDTFNLIGRFDENFILAGDEDNDYKQRCLLAGVGMVSLGISSLYNRSSTKGERAPYAARNGEYLHTKWGQHVHAEDRIYEYDTPFNGDIVDRLSSDYRKHFEISEESTIFMSELEYQLYKNKNKMTLQEIYQQKCTTVSDIYEHLPVLMKYAEKCNHVTEFGVRDVVSTYALMNGKPKIMRSYDISPVENHGTTREQLKQLGADNGVDFEFAVGDTRELDIENTELLFIDTLHTYSQLKIELELHPSKVSKYLIFHDTTTFGPTGEDGGVGLWPAIEEFLISNPEWVIEQKLENNNGLTILTRKS